MSLTLTVTALNMDVYTHYSAIYGDDRLDQDFYNKTETKCKRIRVTRTEGWNNTEATLTDITHILFSASDDAALRAVFDNQNITVDLVEFYIPPAQWYLGSSNTPANIYIGSNLTTMNKWSAQNATLVTGPVPVSSDTGTGKWVTINPQAVADYLGPNGHSLVMLPPDSGHEGYAVRERYTDVFVQIRVTYHYHNSELSISGTPAFGSTITANLTTYLSSYTHKIEYKLNDSAKTTVTLAAGTTSHTFTIPNAWMNQIPNATSALITATLTTYDGSTVVGDQSVQNVTATVPASVVPSPGSISYTVSNPLAVPITNKSLVAALSGQAGVYSSTIKSYTLQCEGYTSQNSNLTVEIITRVPGSATRTLAITATVLDSRGRSASTTLNVTVYEWDVPYFSALEYYRCNSYGTKSEDGRYLRIACTYACYPVTVGSTNKNSITAHTYKIVTKDGSTTIAQGTLSGSAQVVGGGNLSPDEEYYLQLTLTDGVETIVYQYNLYSSAYVIHFRNGGTGVAFGMAADANNTVKINPNWVLIIGNNIDVGAKLADLESRLAALE